MRVTITVAGDRLLADFTGTAPQVKGAINSPLPFTKSAVYACVRHLIGGDPPNNEGPVLAPICCWRCISGPVPVPVLAPDTGKTKTGRLWTYKGGRRRAEFAPDSALEGSGFEPPVPRFRSKGFEMEWKGSYRCS